MESKFLTSLTIELVNPSAYEGRGYWKLVKDMKYQSSMLGVSIVVPKGYETDLTTVPRLPWMFLLLGNIGSQASALHDYLYTSKMYSRSLSDKILREAALVSGVTWWQAALLYYGVRTVGWYSWNKS